jgi:protein-S-isoprenylcysteine O-methyltransferase Ste14
MSGWALFILWEIFWVIWTVFSYFASPKNERPQNLLIQISVILFLIPAIGGVISADEGSLSWHGSMINLVLGFLLVITGFSFSIWARAKLGRNWSGDVRIIPDQKLVQDGPYKIVRHPIYAGLFLATFGTAIVLLNATGGLLFIICVIAFIVKSKKEEILMIQKFGTEYEQYKEHVKMLVPFIV